MPSVFVWPDLAAVIDPPARPSLAYPARGIAELSQPAPTRHSAALARLLGRTRAALLESLAEPASTHTLARRHGLAPSTVSEHLAAMHGARLVTRRRHRHDVLYQQSPLGAELANGGHQPRRTAMSKAPVKERLPSE
jgi:DNA-binding MarR family transcriptional regulator